MLKALWAELKIKTNNAKNDVTSTVRLELHQTYKSEKVEVKDSTYGETLWRQ